MCVPCLVDGAPAVVRTTGLGNCCQPNQGQAWVIEYHSLTIIPNWTTLRACLATTVPFRSPNVPFPSISKRRESHFHSRNGRPTNGTVVAKQPLIICWKSWLPGSGLVTSYNCRACQTTQLARLQANQWGLCIWGEGVVHIQSLEAQAGTSLVCPSRELVYLALDGLNAKFMYR